MTECYCVCIREMYNNPSLFSRAVEKLPWNDRKEKISGFVHNKDKYLCATAGVLLKYLFEINGIRDCTLLKNEYGKLYSKSCPELNNIDTNTEQVSGTVNDSIRIIIMNCLVMFAIIILVITFYVGKKSRKDN